MDWIQTTQSSNKLDVWIENKFMEMSQQIYSHMEKLEFTYVPNLIYKFIDNLTNLFVKLSRERLKSQQTEIDTKESISTLWNILNRFNVLIAPFLPHLAESFSMLLYNMTGIPKPYDSVHLTTVNIESIMQIQLNHPVLNGFYSVNELLEAARNIRQQISRPIYYPLNSIVLYTNSEEIGEFKEIISRELNIKSMEIKSVDSLDKVYKPNKTLLGKVFKRDGNKYIQMIEQGNINWDGCTPDYYSFEYQVKPQENFVGTKFGYTDKSGKRVQSVIYIDTTKSIENDMEAEINNIRRQVNGFRKDMGLKMFNKVEIIFEQNEYWSHMSSTLIDILMNRLVADIKFSDKLDEFKTIETFNGKAIKVDIKLI
jgi:isoleucyl-tRNA synthetase